MGSSELHKMKGALTVSDFHAFGPKVPLICSTCLDYPAARVFETDTAKPGWMKSGWITWMACKLPAWYGFKLQWWHLNVFNAYPPEVKELAPEKWWLEDYTFFFGWIFFGGELLKLPGSIYPKQPRSLCLKDAQNTKTPDHVAPLPSPLC